MNRGAWRATVHGIARVRHNLATQQQQHLPETLEAVGSQAHQVHAYCFPGFGFSFGSSFVVYSAQFCPRWPNLERLPPGVAGRGVESTPCPLLCPGSGQTAAFLIPNNVPYAQDRGRTSGVKAGEQRKAGPHVGRGAASPDELGGRQSRVRTRGMTSWPGPRLNGTGSFNRCPFGKMCAEWGDGWVFSFQGTAL